MKKIVVLFSLLLSTFVYAGKGVKVVVGLSPAGSFEINSSKLKGKAVLKDGQYTASKVKVSVKSLKTGMDLRDKHLKEKLKSKVFRYIKIDKAVASKGKGSAIIVIKKIMKKINFTYSIKGRYFVAKFPINLPDFNFKGINYMGIGVKNIVNVTATLPIIK